MIRAFCYSDATEVTARHMVTVNGLSPQEQDEVARLLLPFAKKAWEVSIHGVPRLGVS